MGNWLSINAEYDPPYKSIEGHCKDLGEAFNNAKTDREIQDTGNAHKKCLEIGYQTYNSALAKTQEKIDLAVLGGTALVVLVVLILVAKQWDRISATFRHFRIDFEAAKMMREKDKERDKADFAQRVQERLSELEKQREG